MTGESISAIGSGLGSSGAYSSYNPSTFAMMSGYGMTNPMLGGYGLNSGMVNPMMTSMMGMGGYYGGNFMQQQLDMLKEYYKYQEELEKFKLDHATEMHKRNQLAEVANLSAHDQAFFLKAMEDGYVQQGIREIYDAIRNGNMDYAVQSFYALKQGIVTKYSEYFNSAEGAKNSQENINNLIRLLYSEIGAAFQPGTGKPDLINDVKTYGETPFQHGFNKTWLGNNGHNQLNAEEALNQMFGTGINDAGSKEKAEQIGVYASKAGEAVAGGVVGAGAGATAFGLAKMFMPDKIGVGKIKADVNLAPKMKNLPKWMKAGLALGLIADGIWQYTR